MTLQKIITRAADLARPEENWTMRPRVILALQVACSLLQLSRTHWLAKRCESSSIQFQRIAENGQRMVPIEPNKPFLAKRNPPDVDKADSESRARPLVLDLGIVLMEIWCSQTLQQRCAQRTIPKPIAFSDRQHFAIDWAKELPQLACPSLYSYNRAIRTVYRVHDL